MMKEKEIRNDWAKALKSVKRGVDLSPIIKWGFSKNDISELAKLHKSNKFRKKIIDLLEDCNFHSVCSDFEVGNYSPYIKEA